MSEYNTKVYRKQGGEELIVEAGGEINIESGGVLAFNGQSVTVDQINAGIALVGAMTGGFGQAQHDTSSAVTVVSANEVGQGARNALLIIKCTETLAGTTLPKFVFKAGSNTFGTIGNTGNPSTFAAGAIAVFAGVIPEANALTIEVTDGSGGTPAGALWCYAIVLPATA